MPIPDLDPQRHAESLANDIDLYIRDAMRRLDTGELVALGELDVSVDALCKRVLAQPAEQAERFVALLNGVRERLDMLQAQMLRAQERLKAELETSARYQKASRAYRAPKDTQ